MPFLAPLIPAVVGAIGSAAPAIGGALASGLGTVGGALGGALTGASGLAANLGRAGLQIGTSLLGSKLTGGTPQTMQGPMGGLTAAQQLGMQTAQGLLPQGQSLIGQAVNAYQPALSYLTRLVSGDRGLMTQALSPQLNQIGQTYNANVAAQEALTPRGGGRAALMTAMPYQQAQTMLDLYNQARSGAVAQLPGIAQGIGSLASPLFGAAVSGLNAATSAGAQNLQYAYLQNQANRQAGQQLGQGIASIFNPAGKQGISNTGGGGPTNPYQTAMNTILQNQIGQAANLPTLPAPLGGYNQTSQGSFTPGVLAPTAPIIYNYGQ